MHRLFLLWLLRMTISQLLIGILCVVLFAQQPPPLSDLSRIIITNTQQLVTVDQRLLALENLRVDARLAVLEKASSDAVIMRLEILEQVAKLGYFMWGVVITLLANLVATYIQIRDSRPREQD